jgi:uncharacterized protein (TIGR01777 family)
MASENQGCSWLLSGASGLLGTALAQALAAQGETVVRLVRYATEGAGQTVAWDPAAEHPVADPSQLEGLRVAVHLSGANVAERRWSDAYKRKMTASRVESTLALSRTLAGLRQPPKVLVVASAVGIYGDRGDEQLTEASAPGTGFLAELCRAWEAAADPARAAGIRVVHARLGVILAHQGGALAKMLPAFRLGLGGPLGNGQQWMSWIALDDAIRALQFVAADPTVSGAVNFVAPEPVTNVEFTRQLARKLHRPALLRAPAFALKLALGQMAEETLLASQRGNPAVLTNAGFQFRYKNADEALEWAPGNAPDPKSAVS